jgi:polysaccharide export outer membrane protein
VTGMQRHWLLARVVAIVTAAGIVGCAPVPRSVTEAPATFSTKPPPVSPSTIVVNDDLLITVYRDNDFSKMFELNPATVLPDGSVLIPLVGPVTAAGLTPDELRGLLARRLQDVLGKDAPYHISPGDTLRLTVYKRSDFSPFFDLTQVPVLPDGSILVPFVGAAVAAGLTPAQLTADIGSRLANVLVDPIVNVVVGPGRPRISPVVSIAFKPTKPKIFVLGEVTNPGVYRIDADTTAVEALALAGGMTRDADRARVLLLRTVKVNEADPSLAAVSIDQLLRDADVRQNVVLRPGDILYVMPDYVARANRILQHISAIVSPIAQVFGVISGLVILNRVQ